MIAVIVQDEQRINYQSAGYRYENRFQTYSLHGFGHYEIVCAAYGYNAEEEQYQNIAHAQIAETGSIEKTEDYATDAYDNHFPTSEKNQRKPYGATQKGSEDDSPFHGSQCYPAFSAGTFRSQPGFVVITMFEVEIIIHQIAVYLHHPCKEQAE